MVRLLNVYYPTRSVFLFVSEAVIVSGSFVLALYYLLGSDAYIALNYEHGWAKIFAMTVLTVMFSYYFDLYEPALLVDKREIYFRLLLVLGFVCLIISALLYFYPSFSMGRNVFSYAFFLMVVLLLAFRRAYLWFLSKSIFRERTYILGRGEFAQMLSQVITSRKDLGMEVVGCNYSLPDGSTADSAAAAIQALLKLKTRKLPHRVIVAMENPTEELPNEDLLLLRFKGVILEEGDTLMERLYGKIRLDGLRASHLLFVEGFRVRPSQQFTRRVASFLAAAVGLILFAPFFPFVLLAIRLTSPGPIFFGQVRVGEGGKTFTVYKFRSMRTDAEAGGAKWASKNDPRVTKFGMIMRKTRIDEIPQLWNVLRGDMGFVGPRPERPEFVPWLAEQLPFYNLRHMIRPGLTGWAQVRYGYGATLEESREKLAYDLYYVKHASLGLDLLIMFETIKIILHRKGAQ